MAARDRSASLRVHGLAKLNRDLGKISTDMRKESVAHLRDVAREVRDDARPITPVKTGRLQRSLRYQASNRGASVSSNVFYARFQEYGTVNNPPRRMLGRAVEQNTERIEDEVGALLDRVARLNGFT